MTGTNHLTQDTLVRAFDGELSAVERLEIELHLGGCEQCLEEFDRLADLSNEIAWLVDRTVVSKPRQAREQLMEQMAASVSPQQSASSKARLFAWASAAAALLALAVGFGDYVRHSHSSSALANATVKTAGAPAAAISSEPSFIRLPYSNPALPLESEKIVRVNLRLSDLASAGVVKIASQAPDAWIQADVLLGMDGEPYGIRLLENAPGN